MERGDGSYRRAENWETAVNKGHHNQVDIRYNAVTFSPIFLLHLYKIFKLCSSKLWLFYEFDCLTYYNGNGKVRKVFYFILFYFISVTTMLAVYYQGKADLTVYNHGNDLDGQLHFSLAKGYGQSFVQPLKTMIYAAVLDAIAIFLFYMVQVSKGR